MLGLYVDSYGEVGKKYFKKDVSIKSLLSETDRCCNQSGNVCICSMSVWDFMISILLPGDDHR